MRADLFEQLLESVRQMKAIRKGELAPGREFTMEDPAKDVTSLREHLKLSQAKFAQMIGVNVRTLQNWEQGHRKPEGPARVLLKVAAAHPDAVLSVVAKHSGTWHPKEGRTPKGGPMRKQVRETPVGALEPRTARPKTAKKK